MDKYIRICFFYDLFFCFRACIAAVLLWDSVVVLRWWARFGAVLRKLFHAHSGTLLSALHRCSMLCFRLGRQSIFIEIYANLVGCRRCGKGAVGRLACK